MSGSCKYCDDCKAPSGQKCVSHSTMLGPSIDEIIVCFLFLLANSLCEKLGILHKKGMKVAPCNDKKDDDMNSWLSQEIKELAVQLSMLGYDLNEPGLCPPTQSMFQARKFVLNRLAEMMEKKDELEHGSNGSGSQISNGDSLCS